MKNLKKLKKQDLIEMIQDITTELEKCKEGMTELSKLSSELDENLKKKDRDLLDLKEKYNLCLELGESSEIRNRILEKNVEQKRKTNIGLLFTVAIQVFIIVICLLILF